MQVFRLSKIYACGRVMRDSTTAAENKERKGEESPNLACGGAQL